MLDLSDIEGLFNGQMKGWAGIDDAGKSAAIAREKERTEQREEYLADARTLAKVFGTAEGRAALGLLFKMTIGRPPSEEEVSCASEFQYVRAKALRDGQNHLVFVIFQMLRDAKDVGALPIASNPGATKPAAKPRTKRARAK